MNIAIGLLGNGGTPSISISAALAVVVLGAIGVIVLVAAARALSVSGLFCKGSRFVLAACTAALSVIALLGMPSIASKPTTGEFPAPDVGSGIEGLLVPYGALGLTLILLPLLLLPVVCLWWVKKLCMSCEGEAQSTADLKTNHDHLKNRGDDGDARSFVKTAREVRRRRGEQTEKRNDAQGPKRQSG